MLYKTTLPNIRFLINKNIFASKKNVFLVDTGRRKEGEKGGIVFSLSIDTFLYRQRSSNRFEERTCLCTLLQLWLLVVAASPIRIKSIKVNSNPNSKLISIYLSFQMYSFVSSASSDFTHRCTLVYLYKCMIRSKLQYACSTWDTFYKKYVDDIERTQWKCFRAIQCYTFQKVLSKTN